MNSYSRILLLGLVLSCGLCTVGAESSVALSGSDIERAIVAIKRFKEENPEARLINFEVHITHRKAEIDVAFLPNPVPGSMLRGGRTEFGKEVHYVFLKQSLTISRTTFGR
jgi:hypothetical protein